MTAPRTMFDKIWDRHAIHVTDDGQTLLYIDRHLLTDGALGKAQDIAEHEYGGLFIVTFSRGEAETVKLLIQPAL